MCEDEGTRGGDGTAEAARCGVLMGREDVGCASRSGGGELQWDMCIKDCGRY